MVCGYLIEEPFGALARGAQRRDSLWAGKSWPRTSTLRRLGQRSLQGTKTTMVNGGADVFTQNRECIRNTHGCAIWAIRGERIEHVRSRYYACHSADGFIRQPT